MTIAWYGHLKSMREWHWLIVAGISWGIAAFEYLLQVPANRMAAAHLRLSELKVMQEIISMAVFVPFSVLFMQQPVTWRYGAAALCLIAAAWFIFGE